MECVWGTYTGLGRVSRKSNWAFPSHHKISFRGSLFNLWRITFPLFQSLRTSYMYKQVQLQWTPSIKKSEIQCKISDLTKNCCINITMQKISCIHQFILAMQQILQSHGLKKHAHSWPCPPKNYYQY